MPSHGKPSYRDLASPRGDNAYCKDYGSRWTNYNALVVSGSTWMAVSPPLSLNPETLMPVGILRT